MVFVTDIFSRSAGDIAPNYFIGDGEHAGYLGNSTRASIVGCLDGREFGFISVSNSFPSNTNPTSASKNLVDRKGNPVSPFTFNMDWGGISCATQTNDSPCLDRTHRLNLSVHLT